MYINEIESHKKSIFDFWKFTNKDESNMLVEGQQNEDKEAHKIKKVFNFEEDMEELGKKMDIRQREVFSKNECDAIFAIRNDTKTFNIVAKEKILKKDEHEIEKTIKKFVQEYDNDAEEIEKRDFDIFGNILEDKTKIKSLKNNKHREIEKDKYRILEINNNTTLESYTDNIKNYRKLLEEAYGKIQVPYEI